MIIGITGTLGAGKGTVVEFLKEQGFTHLSAREYLIEEAKKRGLPLEGRATISNLANELRKISPTYLVDALYAKAKESGGNSIIESIHTPAEVASLREKGDFILLGLDAELEKRYERISKRKSLTDSVTFEQFKIDSERESQNADPNKQNILACIALADYKLENNGTKEEFRARIEALLHTLQNSK